MNNYYFTFGQAHYNNKGELMRNYWVRVKAKDYQTARQLFVDLFTSIHMPKKDAFVMQYEEEYFERKYFPGGEYMVIGEYSYKNIE